MHQHLNLHMYTCKYLLKQKKTIARAHSTEINIPNLFTTLSIFYAIYIKLIKDFENYSIKLFTVLASYCDNTMIKYFMTGPTSTYEIVHI